MRTERQRGDRHPVHLVWESTHMTAVCGDTYPQLRIAVEYRNTHPMLARDPLFCDRCVKAVEMDPVMPLHFHTIKPRRSLYGG